MSRTAAFALVLASSFTLAACSGGGSLNPFAEKDVRLEGERRPVFAPGSDFGGPRKLPPPNSDYIGATMPAGQVAQPTPPASGTVVNTDGRRQQQVPPPPPLPENPR